MHLLYISMCFSIFESILAYLNYLNVFEYIYNIFECISNVLIIYLW
jgi:hypothetical protein